MAESLGVSVNRWEARPEAGWLPDPDELAGLIRPETRAVILSFPHNPTGALLDRARLEAVVALCRHHGLWLFSDEVYRGLEHDPARRLPAAAALYERAISLGAMAKVYGLAGLRIGWVASQDAELLEHMAAYKDYLTICNSAPSEFLARVALRHGEALIARSREIVRDNLALLDAAFARQTDLLGWVRPTAGTTAFVELRGRLADRGAQAFCEALVERCGVLLAPGALFDYPGDRHFRLGFARRNLPAALAEMEAALPELASL